MKQNHTPGPWFAKEWISKDEYGSEHCRGWQITHDGYLLPMGDMEGDYDEATANAHLIAAAPDLLDALEDCCKALSVKSPEYKAAQAAIAKATKELE